MEWMHVPLLEGVCSAPDPEMGMGVVRAPETVSRLDVLLNGIWGFSGFSKMRMGTQNDMKQKGLRKRSRTFHCLVHISKQFSVFNMLFLFTLCQALEGVKDTRGHPQDKP